MLSRNLRTKSVARARSRVFGALRRTALTTIVSLAVPGLGYAAADVDTKWLDIEGRIQYGYYTEDVRILKGLMEQLASGESPDPLRLYYTALASFRLTLLAADHVNRTTSDDAKAAVDRCVSSLDQATQSREDFAEALALQSGCLRQQAALERWRAPFAGTKSTSQLNKAKQLEPNNARVLLLDAIADYDRAGASREQRSAVLGKLTHAADAFEQERRDVAHVPGWGAAEVYVFLARCHLDRGETLAARESLERALLIAPEYAQARKLMAHITHG
jgi:tetratricopeptide (TPR) repeat protein